jgi:ATP-dependent Clp protease protease subunit
MAKELYLYSPIYDFVAEALISQMEENKSEDIVIRGNTPGGSVFSGWGIIAKMKEHGGKVTMKVDGSVASMGTFILAFAQEAEALEVSKIHLHRADMYINGPEDQAFLDSVNKDLKAKLIQKIDAAKFKEVTGFTIDDLFDPDKRLEVWLSAKNAKAIGLISKIVKLNPTEITAINRFNVAAESKPDTTDPKPQPNKVMTLEEIKAKHPDMYAQIVAEGKKDGTETERKRIQAWESWRHIDAVAVDKGIKEGKDISMSDISEFSAKALSPENLKKLQASNAPDVSTKEDDGKVKTEKDKELVTLEASVRQSLGLDKSKK